MGEISLCCSSECHVVKAQENSSRL